MMRIRDEVGALGGGGREFVFCNFSGCSRFPAAVWGWIVGEEIAALDPSPPPPFAQPAKSLLRF